MRHDPDTFVEEIRVKKFKQYLDSGPSPTGGYRKHAIVQFWSDVGALRTIEEKCITKIR